jgi:homoserine kinase type II
LPRKPLAYARGSEKQALSGSPLESGLDEAQLAAAGGFPVQPREHCRFEPGELAVVLSHYDLGVIESVTDFPRGSRRSPKVGLVAEKGKFLLKRRAVSRAHPERVRLTHRLQQRLAAASFPVPKLIATRDGRHTFVQLREQVYELFEFVGGQPYGQTAAETRDAGATLARFHQATEAFDPGTLPVPRGDYHDAAGVRTGLCAIGSTLSSHDSFSGDQAELATLIQFLLEQYDRAADAVNSGGFGSFPERMTHSDWHPGNLLFRKDRVVAVVDYDSARLARRVIDVANGALQFSMLAGGDPAVWPDNLDETRYHEFLVGYESLLPLAPPERASLPHLMAEALITECVPPITETGSVGQYPGFRILLMVRRKLRWIEANRERLAARPV